MNVKWLKISGTWQDVKASARSTIGKDGECAEPSDKWKKQIMLAEHSPIRKIKIAWKWEDLPYWVSVHFVRHKFGIEHFVSTQRTDRTGEDRTVKQQDAPVSHECEANLQAIINISRKRLCNKAAKETRNAWLLVKWKIELQDHTIASCMVRECVYRGFCPEMQSCGFVNTVQYAHERKRYAEVNPDD